MLSDFPVGIRVESVCLGISDEQMSQVKNKNLESRFILGRGQGERG